MKMRLEQLELTCKKSVERIDFADITYFYGEMGAGKSTIARLIDYCLGSRILVMTPALQSEFVAATLRLTVGDTHIQIDRERESSRALVTWDDQQVVIPVRDAVGIVIPDSEVEVLSDLIFHIQGMSPPRVRKSQIKEDSELERLSLRDLLWYCYLDQDSMDSSFFHLDRDADTFKRLKSRNVLRSILGVHQERVAELEQELEKVRRQRLKYAESAKVLKETLEDAEFSTIEEIDSRISEAKEEIKRLKRRIKSIRTEKVALSNHVSDKLRKQAQQYSSELQSVELTIEELTDTIANDKRHKNEILALSTKVKRLESARAVLNDVDFDTCPRCTQSLPLRSNDSCPVCGQEDNNSDNAADTLGEETQADIASRVSEIDEIISAQTTQIERLRRRREQLRLAKKEVDENLTISLKQYDSAYLAEAIDTEKQLAEFTQEVRFLEKQRPLPVKVDSLEKQADNLATEEVRIRRELKDVRAAAEQDLTNLKRLKEIFINCLTRAKIAGFESDDIVHMSPPWFLPEVLGASGEMATTSFSTLGSGGKKNLFKCCFGLAIHRLSAELKTLLPNLLIIDSPMKNISERANREQFEGFHTLLYELAQDELRDTQIVLIDKEFCPPRQPLKVSINSRHMKVDSDNEPPLISYYRGK